MPVGRGNECETCYWTALAEARARKDCGAFSSPAMAEHFRAFGAWLIQRAAGHKAAVALHRHLTFILEVERQWQGIPDYERLPRHFSAGRLRRYPLPMRWMQESGLVTTDAALREADSDRRRIQASRDRLPQESPERIILNGYHERLMRRARTGPTSLRSARLAIASAVPLLIFADVMDRTPLDQKTLDGLLQQTPGQRAALSGFVKYLPEQHGAKITLPKNNPDRAYRKRHKGLKAEILELMRVGRTDPESNQRWLCITLVYFHDLPLKTGPNVRGEDITTDEKGKTIRIGGGDYWIRKKPFASQTHKSPA